ncbi:MAG: PqqD family protein [Alphaproteobacteria bacterium]
MTLVYRRAGSFDQEELDDELVVMELESQAVVTLNPTGRLVWEMLETAASRDDIHDLIGSAFPDVDGDSLKGDIQAVLDTLVAARLVTADSGGG